MTTDNATLAAALYGANPTTPVAPAGALYPSALTAAATPVTPPGAGPARAPAPNDTEVTAAALFDGGEPAASAEVYDSVLNSGFDALQYQARLDSNAEDIELYDTARVQAGRLLHEMQIPVPVARELTVALSGYIESPLSDEALAVRNAETEAELRALWKGSYDSNIAAAKRMYALALKTMPSLAEIVSAGAGSDVKFLKALAAAAGKRRR